MALLIAFSGGNGSNSYGGGFGPGEHLLDGRRQLPACRPLRRSQGMPGYLGRVEHVHIDMNVDDVGQTAEPLHLAADGVRSRSDVPHGEILAVGTVEELLLERVAAPHAA